MPLRVQKLSVNAIQVPRSLSKYKLQIVFVQKLRTKIAFFRQCEELYGMYLYNRHNNIVASQPHHCGVL